MYYACIICIFWLTDSTYVHLTSRFAGGGYTASNLYGKVDDLMSAVTELRDDVTEVKNSLNILESKMKPYWRDPVGKITLCG